jgi:hypothetical protein
MRFLKILASVLLITGTSPVWAASNLPPGVPLSSVGVPNGVASLGPDGTLTQGIVPPFSSGVSQYAPTPRGVMDPFSTGLGLYALYSSVPVLSAYSGPLYIARRESDNATLTVTTTSPYNSAAIAAWAGNSDVYVATMYDLSGNGLAISAATTAAQPRLNLSAAYPTFEFDGISTGILATSQLSNWLNNATGATAVFVRKSDNTNATLLSRPLLLAGNGTNGSARFAMGLDTAIGQDVVQGRRLDTDSLNRANGLPLDNLWDTEIGRFNYSGATVSHNNSLAQEARTFQTAGAVSATASLSVTIGYTPGSTSFFAGKIAAIALYTTSLTDAQDLALTTALGNIMSDFKSPAPLLDWGANGQTGPYTQATGTTNYTIDQPDGTTPSYSDIESFYYHHHTRVAVFGGRVWVAYSGAASSEEQGGMVTEINSATAPWTTPYGPQIAVPPQSLPFQLTGIGDVAGTRVSYPRTFLTYGGNLYLIAAVDGMNTVGSASGPQQGEALVAVLCNSNGTLGTPFLISSATYTPLSGVSTIPYNATLGPALMAAQAPFGTWGGSAPGQPASLWQGWQTLGGDIFVEPSTMTLNASGSSLLRLWRKTNGNMANWVYTATSSDGGRSWTNPVRTNISSPITETTGLQLGAAQDNDIVVIGNPTPSRDPLYVATFSPTTGAACGVLTVRSGLPETPTYANGQTGSEAYPGVASDGTSLYVTYSQAKQVIYMTTVPLANLAVCN